MNGSYFRENLHKCVFMIMGRERVLSCISMFDSYYEAVALGNNLKWLVSPKCHIHAECPFWLPIWIAVISINQITVYSLTGAAKTQLVMLPCLPVPQKMSLGHVSNTWQSFTLSIFAFWTVLLLLLSSKQSQFDSPPLSSFWCYSTCSQTCSQARSPCSPARRQYHLVLYPASSLPPLSASLWASHHLQSWRIGILFTSRLAPQWCFCPLISQDPEVHQDSQVKGVYRARPVLQVLLRQPAPASRNQTTVRPQTASTSHHDTNATPNTVKYRSELL